MDYQSYFDGTLLLLGTDLAILRGTDGRERLLVMNVPLACAFETYHAREAREFLQADCGCGHGDQVRIEGLIIESGGTEAILVNRAWGMGRDPAFR
jgi:hypothetical protein